MCAAISSSGGGGAIWSGLRLTPASGWMASRCTVFSFFPAASAAIAAFASRTTCSNLAVRFASDFVGGCGAPTANGTTAARVSHADSAVP